METLKLFEILGAGGDLSTIAILVMFIKHHTRLTIIETKLAAHVKH